MFNLADLLGRVAPPRGPRPSVAPTAIATDTRGIAALELALTTPFMILLLMGIFDFGTYAYEAMEVKAAAYAGAEAAVSAVQNQQSCTTPMITAAEQSATSLGKSISTSGAGPGATASCSYTGYVNTNSNGASTLSTSCSGTCPTAGTYAVAYAQTSFSPLLSWTGLVLPSTISSTAMVRFQ
jgi:Flp pilus assembly protein TadG